MLGVPGQPRGMAGLQDLCGDGSPADCMGGQGRLGVVDGVQAAHHTRLSGSPFFNKMFKKAIVGWRL